MRIAIIGAGHVGKALARTFIEAGNTVRITAKHFSHAEVAAEATGAIPAESNREAVENSDIVILALRANTIRDAAAEIADVVGDRTVIDVSNPINMDMTGITSARSGAEEVQEMLPTARVVKAFNTILSAHQADPKGEQEPIDAFYAGDDPDAKEQVAHLLRSLGYRPIDAGPLKMARVLEDMALLNIRLNALNGWSWQSEWKLVGVG